MPAAKMPFITLLLLFSSTTLADDLPINPVPRESRSQVIKEWTFSDGLQGWKAQNQCTVSNAEGLMKIHSLGEDPYLHCGANYPRGHFILRLRARFHTSGRGSVFWETGTSRWSEKNSNTFRLQHDGKWREYEVHFSAEDQLTHLRIDPGTNTGEIEIDWIRLERETFHPLTIIDIDSTTRSVRFHVKNNSDHSVNFTLFEKPHTIEPFATSVIEQPLKKNKPLESVSLELLVESWPIVRRQIFIHHPEIETGWIEVPLDGYLLRVAVDGSIARIEQQGKLICFIGPLVHLNGKIPHLKLVSRQPEIHFQGKAISMTLSTTGKEISISIEGQQTCTGPVVRHLGTLEQGLLAGLEYLSRGEKSSSRLDVETKDHLRFAPAPLKVTIPLMSYVTAKASVAMTWEDTDLQPLYATPDFFNGSEDHYMALKGKKIDTIIRVDRSTAEQTALWAVKKHGLPPLPEAPRSTAEQWNLCLQALNGPLKSEAGWGHCAGERWKRHPYADMASTIWRLTGEIPDFPNFQPGGAHVKNDSIFFVTGRADQWLKNKSQKVHNIIKRQQADGSFRYDGKYRRGHFENTASGLCALPAVTLLDFAWMTGDKKSLEAGIRTLDYMKRFRTPRGAQTWEVPLHTPDLLASANLVHAYVRGYELTGKKEYLEQAKKWAMSGLPFIYMWQRYPIMAYATPPVYGATNWQAPMWIGYPVQWVGGVYAYAITGLASYDETLDWKQLARGILHCGEQMQYPDGEYAGLFPDAFNLEDQQRNPARINPCALVSLRLILNEKLDSLAVATSDKHRVLAPFPIGLKNGHAHIHARAGVNYQIIIDGKRIIDINSQGEDVIEID